LKTALRFALGFAAVWAAVFLAPPAAERAASAVPPGARTPAAADSLWRSLAPGLDVGEFQAPTLSPVGDSRIRVLRIDPRRFALRLLSASREGHARSARTWCRDFGLVAAVNASMFQEDGRTSVSLLRGPDHVNNAHVSRDKTVLVFDPVDSADAPVRMLDRECDDFDAWLPRYRSHVQSIRMISCTGRNVWSQQPRRWSAAAVGLDRSGRVLFIHARSPYSTHDLIDHLQQLPLEIDRCMYVEGGPEAQVFAAVGDEEIEWVGSFQTGFFPDNSNRRAWPVPNVIAVTARAGDAAGPED